MKIDYAEVGGELLIRFKFLIFLLLISARGFAAAEFNYVNQLPLDRTTETSAAIYDQNYDHIYATRGIWHTSKKTDSLITYKFNRSKKALKVIDEVYLSDRPTDVCLSNGHIIVLHRQGAISLFALEANGLPSLRTKDDTILAGKTTSHMACDGNNVFVSSTGDDTLYSLAFDPSSKAFSLNSQVVVGDAPLDVVLNGTLAYIANKSDNTLGVVDISNPASLSLIATVDAVGSKTSGDGYVNLSQLAVHENKLFGLFSASWSWGGMSVFDLTTPSAPTLLEQSSGNHPGSNAVVIKGDHLFSSGYYADKLGVVDLSSVSLSATNQVLDGYSGESFGRRNNAIIFGAGHMFLFTSNEVTIPRVMIFEYTETP